jgi:hypothetical protein
MREDILSVNTGRAGQIEGIAKDIVGLGVHVRKVTDRDGVKVAIRSKVGRNGEVDSGYVARG